MIFQCYVLPGWWPPVVVQCLSCKLQRSDQPPLWHRSQVVLAAGQLFLPYGWRVPHQWQKGDCPRTSDLVGYGGLVDLFLFNHSLFPLWLEREYGPAMRLIWACWGTSSECSSVASMARALMGCARVAAEAISISVPRSRNSCRGRLFWRAVARIVYGEISRIAW